MLSLGVWRSLIWGPIFVLNLKTYSEGLPLICVESLLSPDSIGLALGTFDEASWLMLLAATPGIIINIISFFL